MLKIMLLGSYLKGRGGILNTPTVQKLKATLTPPKLKAVLKSNCGGNS